MFPLTSAEFLQDPYPFYKRLRQEAPFYESGLGFTVVSRYSDVHQALTSQHVVKGGDPPPWLNPDVAPALTRFLTQDMAFAPRDEHARIRRAVNRHFTPKALASLAGRMEEVIEASLSDVAARGTFDVVEEFAAGFPVTVIAEMLGIPDADHGDCYRATVGLTRFIEPMPSAQDIAEMDAGFAWMMAYAEDLVGDRRRNPREDDLLTVVIQANEETGQLSADELTTLVTALFLGGHETTKGTVSNGVSALIKFPDQHQLLRERPELSVNATEEVIRWDSVSQLQPRQVLEPITVGEREFQVGERLVALLGSANRDETRHDDPDRFDIQRVHDKRSHLGFGGGPYFCLGASFARIETEIVFRLLPQRFSEVDLVELVPGRTPSVRSPDRMIVSVKEG